MRNRTIRSKNIKKIRFIKADVCELNNLKLPKFDWIIHSSAIAPLPDNQINHYDSIVSNIAQCGSVIDFCIHSGTKNLIFFSSSAIYEKELKKTIAKFEKDEREHHDIGLEHDAESAPGYKIMTKVIEIGCKTAIAISKKI